METPPQLIRPCPARLDALILRRLSDPKAIDEMCQNSFKNFHTKGLDYICLHRSPEYTVKLYILDGDASKSPEVVNPHDHRYAFRTTVLAGQMLDHRFTADWRGELYNAFDYQTPLNGGAGFIFRGEERLLKASSIGLLKGDKLETAVTDLHTIQMAADQTVLMLEQFADALPVGVPTACWVKKGEPEPNTSGMYERFTEGGIAAALEKVFLVL